MSRQEVTGAKAKIWSTPKLVGLDADLTYVAGGNGFPCQSATLKNASVTVCLVS